MKTELELFEQALIDWNRPFWKRWFYGSRFTDKGLCCYFNQQLGLTDRDVIRFLEPIWVQFKTRRGIFDFNNRKERIQAIRKCIEHIKNKKL